MSQSEWPFGGNSASAASQKFRVLIAAYDVSRSTSEGHIAMNLVERIGAHSRITIVTRVNNAEALKADMEFRRRCPFIKVIGIDLPRWAAWWKKGARFYQAYAYLWQLWWPLVFRLRRCSVDYYDVVHVLNFHNDGFPSLAWWFGRPTVWGPLNHNETVAAWRRKRWPLHVAFAHQVKSTVRMIQWKCDPILRLTKKRMDVIISAGPWVEQRLRLQARDQVVRRSQLGTGEYCRQTEISTAISGSRLRLLCAGRLDWIKGIDLSIEALRLLPEDAQLTLIGDGPARELLETVAHDGGVGGRVIFKGGVPREELIAEFTKFDLMLFPSAEAAGLVWVEALSSGLPVVAFDGPTEIAMAAKKVPGIFLAKTSNSRHFSVSEYARTIKEAARSNVDRQRMRSAAIERYGWSGMAEEILAVYNRAVERRK